MLVALVGLEGSWQFVHEVRAEEIEVLMQGILCVYIDQFVLLNDEEILGNEDLSDELPPICGEVVERNDDFGVLVEGGRIVDFQVFELYCLILDIFLATASTDARFVDLVFFPIRGVTPLRKEHLHNKFSIFSAVGLLKGTYFTGIDTDDDRRQYVFFKGEEDFIGEIDIEGSFEFGSDDVGVGAAVMSIEDFAVTIEVVRVDLGVHDCVFELRLFKIVNIVIFGLEVVAVETGMRMLLVGKLNGLLRFLPAETLLVFNFHFHFNIIICGDSALNTAFL